MKPYRWLILGLIGCLLVAGGAYFWATNLMDSLYNFRSPLHGNPPGPGQALGQPITRRVVVVLIDALRADTSLKPEVMPTLNQLRDQAAWATMHSQVPSYSEPGYSVLMTGAWPYLSDGPAMNLDYADIPTWTQDNLFSAAHRAGLKTAVSGYYWFEKLIPQEAVDASFYTPGEDKIADREVVDHALPWLQSGDYNFVLIHIDQVDYAGHHEGGPRDPRWDAAATRSDDLLREIISQLDLEQDTVIVLSDHGQIDRGGHGGQDPIVLVEPFVMAGAGVKPGRYPDMYQVDVAPTVAALLGTNLPASSQGNVLTEMLTLSPDKSAAISDALNQQQMTLSDAYQKAIGYRVAPDAGEKDILGYYQGLIEKAKNARLEHERTPRFLFAAILMLIPAILLVWKRSRMVAWLFGGAGIYLVLFNFIYAGPAGRTYSLSSVASSTDIILTTALISLLALTVAWLILSFSLKSFKDQPLHAAETALGLTFVTLYLLALPILWSFALNGALIGWTLPDFASMFLGFLSTIQSLVVAVAGIILTGVAALIARIVNQKPELR
jgi:hypothetical protein